MTEINWNINKDEKTTMRLADSPIGETHEVKFMSVFQTESGAIGANVESTTLAGDVLWLSGDFGPSNGFNSLVKAVGSPESIEGSVVKYTRVNSEKSPSGYANWWTQ